MSRKWELRILSGILALIGLGCYVAGAKMVLFPDMAAIDEGVPVIANGVVFLCIAFVCTVATMQVFKEGGIAAQLEKTTATGHCEDP